MLEYQLESRGFMYEVDTIISKSEIYSDEKIADLFDNVLRLTFKTEDEYIKFM